MSASVFDLLIIGGGVSGSALFYTASRYSALHKIGLLEKYPAAAQVNSLSSNNSQTLHCGDIETNYSLDKALKVQRAARMLENYATAQNNRDELIFRFPKMVLAVGETECVELKQRYERFKPHYPKLRWLEAKDIAAIEPRLLEQRQETIAAMGSTDENTAVDFGALARSFIRQGQNTETAASVHFECQVHHIERSGELFRLHTSQGEWLSRAVVVCAGGHSLKLAQQMGYGRHYSVLPVAGSYYFTPTCLNGKVYTVQNDALPFAAIHGDPDVGVPGQTRFGPTALVLPILERYNWKTLPDFLRVFRFDRHVANVLWQLLRNPVIRHYMLRNVWFEIPGIRRRMFLRDARKIVPSLQLKDVRFAKRFGGIRPQLIDKKARELKLGEAKIDTEQGLIFNMTPSPGATSCLENAEIDLRIICRHLQVELNEDRLKTELLKQDPAHSEPDFTGAIFNDPPSGPKD